MHYITQSQLLTVSDPVFKAHHHENFDFCAFSNKSVELNNTNLCYYDSNYITDSFIILGIILDRKLSWKPHLRYVHSKTSKNIYLFHRLSTCVIEKYLLTTYFGFIHSVITYSILLWVILLMLHLYLVCSQKPSE